MHLPVDFFATLARKFSGMGVAKESISAIGLHSPMESSPPRRV
jgi:hypothetical protein